MYSDQPGAFEYAQRNTDPSMYYEQGDDDTIETAPQYFRLLSESATGSPRSSSPNPSYMHNMDSNLSNQGYYERFFVEIAKLGRGARGSVYLCQHVLHGHALGRYAIKKVPVGDQAETLLSSLNEVHLMESLNHPNVISYKHAWVEMTQISPFTPVVPTLHVLMMAANGGSLADWIAARAGETDEASMQSTPRVERLKDEFRQRRAAMQCKGSESTRARTGVHLLREEEIVQLLQDITHGLAFLHEKGILHLDIKPGNVLLHWDDDALLPSALLSDFGSSMPQHQNWARKRTGHTGTIEYMAPEAVLPDANGHFQEITSKADIWSLGVLFHLLVFFELPYTQVDDFETLRKDIVNFRDFKENINKRGLHRRFATVDPILTDLLAEMLHVNPQKRPSCPAILAALEGYHARNTQPKSSKESPSFKHERDSLKSSTTPTHQRGMSRGQLLPPASSLQATEVVAYRRFSSMLSPNIQKVILAYAQVGATRAY
ncbi:putative serine/threonine-protein kinase iks1 [Malassezia yamatoensis]|uniref:non-specific serine/threonine protein kinase n=1 Tax=Malassezia yamatoensis TaxID=253288 RepID=A0AAJ5YPJ5_9BASI|nr:putative serine/threonine-protein kinase iks1 [Malassezia yamatoensis]